MSGTGLGETILHATLKRIGRSKNTVMMTVNVVYPMIEDGLEDAVDIGSGNFSARLHRALEALYARMSILWDVYDSISERIDIAGRLAGTWVIIIHPESVLLRHDPMYITMMRF